MNRITSCRLCGNTNLVTVLDLGEQSLSGVFPLEGEAVPTGPLVLDKCHGENACGLVQLAHTGDLSQMYGAGYGYRSGLNAGMVRHLADIVKHVTTLRPLELGDLVLDIGSNDGTTLAQYPPDAIGDDGYNTSCLIRMGIDPTARYFRQHYPDDAIVVPEFFSASVFNRAARGMKATIVTSISMLYDLPDPLQFARDVASVLTDDGVWLFEQSYLPSMLEANAYDTVCHEHLEYYGLRQIEWMLTRAGLTIIDVVLNDTNGGSICVTAAKMSAGRAPSWCRGSARARTLIAREVENLSTLAPFESFERRVKYHAAALKELLTRLKAEGKTVLGLGASTKGNVVLQYAQITPDLLPMIGEVNSDKFGKVTPGTCIPIVDEARVHAENPDVLLVLPWHFRESFVEREAAFLARGGKLLFPLPSLEMVSG